MQTTPKSNRPHIAVFGRRNAGKSSLINVLTNQDLAIVSDVPGTTADPVYKAMELLPLGPVMMIDTAGIDDSGTLGELRVKKTMEVIRKTDLALIVIDALKGINSFEIDLIEKLKSKNTAMLVVINKIDLLAQSNNITKKKTDNNCSNSKPGRQRKDIIDKNAEEIKSTQQYNLGNISLSDIEKEVKQKLGVKPVLVSAHSSYGIEKLRDEIANSIPEDIEGPCIIGDLIEPGATVVLVVPIDAAAPKGRLILPQVQTIRDILDHKGISVVCKDTELEQTLHSLKNEPAMVVTDSQAFAEVDKMVPSSVLLTGFSVLFARYKGDLALYIEGAKKLANLTPGSKILIAEACTHRRQIDDIGTIKIPNWLREKVSENLVFDHSSGRDYPEDLNQYDLILHCGGCMLNRKEVLSRLDEAREAGVPVINYGMAIAQLHGILDRALKPFPEIYQMWQEYEGMGGVSYG